MDHDTIIQHLRDAIALIERAIEVLETGGDPGDLLVNAIGHLERALGDPVDAGAGF